MKKVIFILTIVIFSGCVSVIEKTGKIIDGSAFAEKIIHRYKTPNFEILTVENKDNIKSIIITMEKYPMMKLRTSYPDENGNFHFTTLDYLGGNLQGWNEFSLELLGEGNLVLDETSHLTLNGEIQKAEIVNGRIHRYDTRITGDEAVTALRNRRQRIDSIVEWMLTLNAPKGQDINDFEDYWKPIFFPELVSNRKKPAGWKQDSDVFVRADDVRWNTGYTERVFSEILIPVRDSGTLLRDFEEALYWIYLEYEWENIVSLLK